MVADLLQLAEVRDAPGWSGKRPGLRFGYTRPGRVLRVSGQLGLQSRDLGPQGLAGGELVEVARWLRLPGRPGLAAGVDGASQLPRVDTQSLRCFHRVSGHLLQRRRDDGAGGDEGAPSVLGDDEALLLEPAVERPRGVHVDAGGRGEVAYAGKPIARRKPAAEDQRPHPPGQGDSYRELVRPPKIRHRFGRRRAVLRRLCHCANTVALSPRSIA